MERLAVEGGEPIRKGEPVPLFKPKYGIEELKEILEVFQSGAFCRVVPGAGKVKEFEEAFASYVGVKHAIAVNSGTTAQHTSLAALGIGPGDEVIVPPLTFVSTAYTVLWQQAKPVFADVDEDTFNISPDEIRRKVTRRTKAIVPVHWFGNPAKMDEILKIAEEKKLKVIEDCAHAYGTEYNGRKAGTMGVMGCWSLVSTTKIISCGEGGVVTTDNDELAKRARAFSDHGKFPSAHAKGLPYGFYRITILGNNYRLSELGGAFALAQLRRLDEIWMKRKSCFEYLTRKLGKVDGLVLQNPKPYVKHAYAHYPVRFLEGRFRKGLVDISRAIAAEGVENYPITDEVAHLHPIFMEMGSGYGEGSCPVAEKLGRETILLPIHTELTIEDLDDIAAATVKVAEAYSK